MIIDIEEELNQINELKKKEDFESVENQLNEIQQQEQLKKEELHELQENEKILQEQVENLENEYKTTQAKRITLNQNSGLEHLKYVYNQKEVPGHILTT